MHFRKNIFSSQLQSILSLPNLIDTQLNSYRWFLKTGLRELFDEISPIKDYTDKEFALWFGDYYLDEPKFDERRAKEHNLSYEASLRVKVRLENKKTKKTIKQEVFLGDFPLMTPRGTFIVNGVERVVVSQLIRSPGIFFTAQEQRGKKLFGAKIIPNRGSWLEFETDSEGIIYVRIDRKRKIPVTALLRIFGLEKDEDIKKAVAHQDIEKILKKDPSKNQDEAFIEIYRRLRPTELAAADNARQFIQSLLFNFARYDLSQIGRYKLYIRLHGFSSEELRKKEIKEKDRLLNKDDIVAIIKEIIRLNSEPDAKPDDIDHLGNRRVKAVGELIQGRLRLGLVRMRRMIQDRMSTQDTYTAMPSMIINNRPFIAAIKGFLTSSQLAQFMDQVNPLSELEQKRRLSAMGPGGLTRERAGFEVRDVHPSHYGRICPIETPEGPNIGLVGHLATYARVNNFGFLEAPYRRVKKGRVTDEIVYLMADEEERYNIAHAGVPYDKKGHILENQVEARIKGNPGLISKEEVDFMDGDSQHPFSVATNLIPFLAHDDATRALMGSNMQRQAVPCIIPQAPLVATGLEEKAAKDSGQVIISKEAGKVIAFDSDHIEVKTKNGKDIYNLHSFVRSNQYTCLSQHPRVEIGQKIKTGQLLSDGAATDNGQLALGQNLLVAFLSFAGANFEDAVILSERLVRNDVFSSIHIQDFSVDVRDTKLGPEITTGDIPNVSEEKLKNLDEEGIIRIGAEVKPGDILVGKISPKGEGDFTPEERLLRAIFGEKAREVKDTSLTLPYGKRGRIIAVKVFSRSQGDKLEPGVIKRIQVEVAQLRKISVGDKLAGRHGNKGVISKILPIEDMPHLEDGTPVDIILNPLGVASRMNIGQILEAQLGWAAHQLGYQAITSSLVGATEKDIKEQLKLAGLPEDGQVILYDGRSGEPFSQKVTIGHIYMMKLNHLVEDKIHMRSIGPYSLITQQPLGGKAQFGGQRFGEMEVWALEGHGCAHTLQEMLTIKSDDVFGRTAVYDAIIRGEEIKSPNLPASFHVLVSELKGLNFAVDFLPQSSDFKSIRLKLASPEEVLNWSHGEVTKPETINYRTQRPEKDGLFDERIFGPVKDWECYCGKYRHIRYKGIICDKCGVEITRSSVRRERMGHIKLAAPVSHIWFLRGIPSALSILFNIPMPELEKVIHFTSYIITKVDEDAKKIAFDEIEREFKAKIRGEKILEKKEKLKELRDRARDELKILVPFKILTELEYNHLSLRWAEVFEAGMGAEVLQKLAKEMNLKKIDEDLKERLEKAAPVQRRKISTRLKIVENMLKVSIRPEWMFLNVIPVIPPELRPMVQLDGGRYASSDLNDLYRRVINRNNRLKRLIELNAPEIITRNEKRMLQEAVDALIDNSARREGGVMASVGQKRLLRSLADMLKGKQGRFRQNLLGKRVDYSGRSVIVVGPELKLGECGLPKRMALELFKPFVINKIIEKGLAHNIKSAGRLIEEGTDDVWAILEEVITDRYVLLNRAPTLHRLGIQAFKPLLIEGMAIQIPPGVCVGFNADFDGDQMAVHVPLTPAAQWEAKNIMLASKNLLKPATGEPIVYPAQDIILGCYWLTKIEDGLKGEGKVFGSKNEAVSAYQFNHINLKAKIKILTEGQVLETSVGRILFNTALPNDFNFINQEMVKKNFESLVSEIIEKYGLEQAATILDMIKVLGFEYATKSGISWGIDDLQVPVNKKEIIGRAEKEVQQIWGHYQQGLLTKEERYDRVIDVWTKVKQEIEKIVPDALPRKGSVYQIISSGARGSWAQPVQMAGMKGLVTNPAQEIIELPIKNSFKEGLNILEYFISTHGMRRGVADTALRTSTAGYLTRRLVDVSQDVVVQEEDCQDNQGIMLYRKDAEELGSAFSEKIFGRILLEDFKIKGKTAVKKGQIIDRKTAQLIDETGAQEIKVRSVINCKTLFGVCKKCYGYDLGHNKLVELGEAIGIIAAQAIGEPGTQLTMRTFHVGGVAGGADITQGLPRVDEIFEARSPKGEAVISEVDGQVIDVIEDEKAKIIRIKQDKSKEILEYSIPRNTAIYVEKDNLVKAGDQLCEGHINLKSLFRVAGQKAVQRYVLKEISQIYYGAGAAINEKHVEVIIRQMFSRVQIEESGGSDLVEGEIMEKDLYQELNDKIKKRGGKLATASQILLGISKVALTSDSFFSAASFQETARVLIKAGLSAKEDKLRGLKENVIIGRLIPAGTGFRARTGKN